MVFISDGATWIRKWEEDAFSIYFSILDYFHAIEHLQEFIDRYFKDKKRQGEKSAEKQNKLLLDSKVKQVIKNIKELAPENEVAKN